MSSDEEFSNDAKHEIIGLKMEIKTLQKQVNQFIAENMELKSTNKALYSVISCLHETALEYGQ